MIRTVQCRTHLWNGYHAIANMLCLIKYTVNEYVKEGAYPEIKQKLKRIWWFNPYCFGHKGAKVLIPMTTIIMLFTVGRQRELEHFSRVYVTYAEITFLQNDLICWETPLYRQMLQTFPRLCNLELVTCSMERYMEGMKKYEQRYPERIQFNQLNNPRRSINEHNRRIGLLLQ